VKKEAKWALGSLAAVAAIVGFAFYEKKAKAAALTASATTTASVYNVSTADAGKTIAMHVGDTLNIALPQTANSGVDWFYTGTIDPTILKHSSRSVTTIVGGLEDLDVWVATGKGSVLLQAQLLPVDSTGAAVAGAAAQMSYNLTLNIS
jgi:hypothetical protein